MDELLSIGDFSARCGLSPKMLRSYAAAGLLVPAAVDGSSGYRYYSGSQSGRARVIALLRRAGIKVADITAFFNFPDAARFDQWERDIESELEVRRQALAQARAAMAPDDVRPKSEAQTSSEKGPSVPNTLVAASATHQGGRDTNQDAELVASGLFAVADGLGGLQAGEVASRVALETLREAFTAEGTRSGLIGACQEANQAVWEQARRDGGEATMGTTLATVGVISDGEPVVVHAGDSRLYRYRNGRVDRLTHDHSVTAELVRRGELTEQAALTHPQRHILTRALGVAPEVEFDVAEISLAPGDRLMLCTDGLFKALEADRIQAALASKAGAQVVADELVAAAVAHEAEDNVTVVVIDVRD